MPKGGLAGGISASISRAKPPPGIGSSRGRSNFLRASRGRRHGRTGGDRQGKGMATTTGTADTHEVVGEDGVRRRDFIEIAAVSAAGVGGLISLLPLISQMSPSKDVLAESTTELDITAIEPGMAIKAMFRKQPVFVRNLTPAEIDAANAVDPGDLRDPQTLAERTKEGRANWLITMGVCTHLGCVPLGAAQGEPRGEFGGYFCPCHGSHYDTAARIRKGPAPTNLEVPEYEFTTDTHVVIG
jgi:ubiquinol-cytochrome c reductase iron-sulfur subunit